jgi:hypothetical protein
LLDYQYSPGALLSMSLFGMGLRGLAMAAILAACNRQIVG